MISYLVSHEQTYTYNLSIAKVFGLCSAVYLNLLLGEQYSAIANNKLYKEKYFVSSRDFIYDKTVLGAGKQKEIEENLIDCQVLVMLPFTNNNNKFYYHVDEVKLEYLIKNSNETKGSLNPETKKVKVLVPTESLPKLTAKQKEIQSAMKAVVEQDAEIYDLYKDWVEVLVTKNGYCAQSQMKINQEDLNKYAGANKQIKVDILRMAIKTGWKNIEYCIKDYAESLKSKNTRNQRENEYQVMENSSIKEDALKSVREKLKSNTGTF